MGNLIPELPKNYPNDFQCSFLFLGGVFNLLESLACHFKEDEKVVVTARTLNKLFTNFGYSVVGQSSLESVSYTMQAKLRLKNPNAEEKLKNFVEKKGISKEAYEKAVNLLVKEVLTNYDDLTSSLPNLHVSTQKLPTSQVVSSLLTVPVEVFHYSPPSSQALFLYVLWNSVEDSATLGKWKKLVESKEVQPLFEYPPELNLGTYGLSNDPNQLFQDYYGPFPGNAFFDRLLNYVS